MQQYLSRSLDGVDTEVTIQNHADGLLVIVTQLGKVGHLIQASIPDAVPLLPPSSTGDGLPLVQPPPSVELTSLFGSAPSSHLATLHSLYASHIATYFWTMTAQSRGSGDRRNVIVGLALKNSHDTGGDDARLTVGEQTTFRGVMRMIVELLRGTNG